MRPPALRPARPAPATTRRPAPRPPRASEETPSDGEVVKRGALAASSVLYAGLRVLLVGGSGRTGRVVARRLVEEGVPTTVLARSGNARAVLPAEVSLITTSALTQPSTLAAALAGCNAVVWAAGVGSPAAVLNPLEAFWVVRQAGGEGVGGRLVQPGARRPRPPSPPFQEADGVANMAAAARDAGVRRFVLISSAGADDPLARLTFPGGVLAWKKRGELALQRSGVPYTILRPGGLTDKPLADGDGVVAFGPGAVGIPLPFGPKRELPGSIPRACVADLAVAALVAPAAAGRVVECVARAGAPRLAPPDLFAAAEQRRPE